MSEQKLCKCECGEMTDKANGYVWGHKKTGEKKQDTQLAMVEPEIVVEAAEPEEELIACELSVSQINRIYDMLRPEEKALAVMTGLTAERE